ncbi:MAG TPA: hypothetical protein VK510_15745 [Solirubrobacteraceae bacterium]|jgi:hypothetical protein|nr:hypothetical protein [Solirubrobacteraceae bacterium]
MLFLLAVATALACTGVGATSARASAPVVTTRVPTAIGPRSVVLQGTVNPKDKPTAYTFEYGTTTAYGALSPTASAGKGKTDVPVSYTLAGLLPSTTYHFRLVASNDSGTSRGADVAFTTAPDPIGPATPSAPTAPGTTPSTPGSAPATTPETAPVLGQSVNVAPATGTVLVRAPGATSSIPLSGQASIRVGAILDTRRGTVDLTTALPGGRTQSATFHGGLVQIRQPVSGRGMTELVLRGAKPSCKRGRARAAATSSRRPPRKLWASDHHGRFRTRGSNAVATVRGTSWYMADRCDGTYTRVGHGSVSVREVRSGRTVVLHAGQSHLARAGR